MTLLSNIRNLFKNIDAAGLMYGVTPLEIGIFLTVGLFVCIVVLAWACCRAKSAKKELSIKDAEIDALRRTIAEINEEKESLASSEQTLKDKCEKFKELYTSLNVLNLVLSIQVKKLEDSTEESESVKVGLQSELSSKEAELSLIKTNLEALQSECDQKAKLLDEANNKIANEVADKTALEESVARLQDANRILSETIDSLKAQIDNLTGENSRIDGGASDGTLEEPDDSATGIQDEAPAADNINPEEFEETNAEQDDNNEGKHTKYHCRT